MNGEKYITVHLAQLDKNVEQGRRLANTKMRVLRAAIRRTDTHARLRLFDWHDMIGMQIMPSDPTRAPRGLRAHLPQDEVAVFSQQPVINLACLARNVDAYVFRVFPSYEVK